LSDIAGGSSSQALSPPVPRPIWIAPLALALAHDWWSRGRVHRTYVIGTAILLVAFTRVLAMESTWWLAIGRRIIDALVPPG
jgi:hypothetical protein